MNFEWQRIYGKPGGQQNTHRAQVIGGWLVKSTFIDEDFGSAMATVFVPDPNHEWTIGE